MFKFWGKSFASNEKIKSPLDSLIDTVKELKEAARKTLGDPKHFKRKDLENDLIFWRDQFFKEKQKAERYQRSSWKKGRMMNYFVKQGYISKNTMKEVSNKF